MSFTIDTQRTNLLTEDGANPIYKYKCAIPSDHGRPLIERQGHNKVIYRKVAGDGTVVELKGTVMKVHPPYDAEGEPDNISVCVRRSELLRSDLQAV